MIFFGPSRAAASLLTLIVWIGACGQPARVTRPDPTRQQARAESQTEIPESINSWQETNPAPPAGAALPSDSPASAPAGSPSPSHTPSSENKPAPQPDQPEPGAPDESTGFNPPDAAGSGPAETSGCYTASSADYSEKGPFTYKKTRSGSFEVWMPEARPGCHKIPVVGFAMGTLSPAFNYLTYYEHFASWGLAVIIEPSALLNLTGAQLKGAMSTMYRDPKFADRLGKAGTMGHSQGGAAAINVATAPGDLPVAAVVGLQPALFTSAARVKAAGLYLGGTADMFSVATDPQGPYLKTDGPAWIGDLQGASHIMSSGFMDALTGGKNLTSYKSMSAAWFRCHLAEDANACSKFSGGDCAFPGKWTRCEGKNL